jgi:excisionase family DNA binding protein
MSVKAAADYLGMSVYTIRDRIARGEIPAVRDGGRIVRLDIQDLDAWIEKRKERLL